MEVPGKGKGKVNILCNPLDQGSDLLVAFNTMPADATGLPQLLHMKPGMIGEIDGQDKVGKLLLTYMVARSINRQDEAVELIRKSYQGPIIFADDLKVFHPSSCLREYFEGGDFLTAPPIVLRLQKPQQQLDERFS